DSACSACVTTTRSRVSSWGATRWRARSSPTSPRKSIARCARSATRMWRSTCAATGSAASTTRSSSDRFKLSRARSAGAALVILFLAAHLVWLPRKLEDLDSVNFALGVRDFDVARHQPHPPGYPIFIALAKVSTGALRLVGVEAPAPRGLAIWSAIGGALALPAMFTFFRRLEGRDTVAAAMWVLAIASGAPSARALMGAGLLAGLAIGIRSQTAVLTLPFLASVVVT